MHLFNMMVSYLYRKYGIPIYVFTRKWTRGTSYLKRTFDVLLTLKHNRDS